MQPVKKSRKPKTAIQREQKMDQWSNICNWIFIIPKHSCIGILHRTEFKPVGILTVGKTPLGPIINMHRPFKFCVLLSNICKTGMRYCHSVIFSMLPVKFLQRSFLEGLKQLFSFFFFLIILFLFVILLFFLRIKKAKHKRFFKHRLILNIQLKVYESYQLLLQYLDFNSYFKIHADKIFHPYL